MNHSNTTLRNQWVIYFGLSIFILWNYWLPSAKGYFNDYSPMHQTYNVDFFAYFRAGQAYLRGQDPYMGTRDGQTYIYPPTLVPFYAQLARLDYETARRLWVGIYTFFFSIAVFLLMQLIAQRDRKHLAVILGVILLVSYPLRYLIRQGQIDLIVASLNFSSLAFYLFNRKNLSAAFLAVSTLVKLNPLFLLITFVIFFRDWKYLLRYGAIIAALVAVSLLFMPLKWYWMYAVQVLPSLTKSTGLFFNQTPLRFIAGSRYLPRLMTILVILVAVVFAWFAGKQFLPFRHFLGAPRQSPQAVYRACVFFLINSIITLFASGSAWIMAYVWFILPLAPVLLFVFQNRGHWLAAGLTLGAAAAHARLVEQPVLNSINMIGASICLVFLLLEILAPDKVSS